MKDKSKGSGEAKFGKRDHSKRGEGKEHEVGKMVQPGGSRSGSNSGRGNTGEDRSNY